MTGQDVSSAEALASLGVAGTCVILLAGMLTIAASSLLSGRRRLVAIAGTASVALAWIGTLVDASLRIGAMYG